MLPKSMSIFPVHMLSGALTTRRCGGLLAYGPLGLALTGLLLSHQAAGATAVSQNVIQAFLPHESPGLAAEQRSKTPDSYRVAMDWDRVKGNWKQFEGKIKEQWGKLTNDDLEKAAGRREYLEGLIQERYGLSKDEVRKQVDDWLNQKQWD